VLPLQQDLLVGNADVREIEGHQRRRRPEPPADSDAVPANVQAAWRMTQASERQDVGEQHDADEREGPARRELRHERDAGRPRREAMSPASRRVQNTYTPSCRGY
jgi:hypothetical protein